MEGQDKRKVPNKVKEEIKIHRDRKWKTGEYKRMLRGLYVAGKIPGFEFRESCLTAVSTLPLCPFGQVTLLL